MMNDIEIPDTDEESLLDNDCPICFEPLNDDVRVTLCEHTFHTQCIGRWFQYNGSCPVCRTVLIEGIENPGVGDDDLSDIFPYHCICGNWRGLYVNAHQRSTWLLIHVILMILSLMWLYNLVLTWKPDYIDISLAIFLSIFLLYYSIVTILVGFHVQWYVHSFVVPFFKINS